MHHFVSERMIGLAVLICVLGVILVWQTSLFVRPVLVSEKGLLLLIVGIGLIVSSVFVAVRSVRKVE
jgi:hypothetical protein